MLAVTEIFLERGIPAICQSSGVDVEEGVAGEGEHLAIDLALLLTFHREGGGMVQSLAFLGHLRWGRTLRCCEVNRDCYVLHWFVCNS